MDHDEPTRARLRGLAAELGLLPTGSSDYHGTRKTVRLGEYTTDPEIYGEITRRATGAFPVPGAGGPRTLTGTAACEPSASTRRPFPSPSVRHPRWRVRLPGRRHDLPARAPPCSARSSLARLTVFDIAVFGSLFLTLFVIMDPPGITPIFLALTAGRPAKVQRRMALPGGRRRLRRDRRLRPAAASRSWTTCTSPSRR